jgi:signal transduction histidine kinase
MLYAVLPVLVWAALRGGWQAVGIAGVAVAFGTDWVAVTGRAGDLIISGPSGTQLVFIQIFLGVTILAGLTLAVEVADRERAEATLRSTQAEQNRIELEFTTAALHERQRIARDTHDIVGHALNVMLLQTAAARRAAPADTGNTTKLLQSVESVGRQALQELEVALGLADPEPAMLATKGLSHVPHLVETMRRAGMNVELDIDGNSHIPALVDRSAYRIIEEAMTNVAKHAPTASTQITIRFEPDRLVVSVRDDGAMTPPARVSGHGRGLAGMRERVAMLGGALTAGRLPDKGFAVEAVIPYRAVT